MWDDEPSSRKLQAHTLPFPPFLLHWGFTVSFPLKSLQKSGVWTWSELPEYIESLLKCSCLAVVVPRCQDHWETSSPREDFEYFWANHFSSSRANAYTWWTFEASLTWQLVKWQHLILLLLCSVLNLSQAVGVGSNFQQTRLGGRNSNL